MREGFISPNPGWLRRPEGGAPSTIIEVQATKGVICDLEGHSIDDGPGLAVTASTESASAACGAQRFSFCAQVW